MQAKKVKFLLRLKRNDKSNVNQHSTAIYEKYLRAVATVHIGKSN
jgi:uncharacterized protein (UPF0335 family)